ncbi:MAG: TRAP transporter substrate-binding protein DctP [Deltaproteobacteria bacterium]|nr:TRAP transporter substrate-binding protein DctP [Deltaproteobacteria bacterium]
MKKTLAFIGISLLMVIFTLQVANAAPKKLKAVCFLPKNHPLAAMTIEWVKRINEACKGELEIQYMGGPEVIPGLEQVEALRKGVIQVTFNVAAYYQSIFPEGVAFTLSKLTPWEERKPGGFYDLMVERHKRINVMYLGRWLHGPFYIWLKDPVSKLDDMKGRKLRTTALYDRFMKALGAVPVTISMSETYTALERGTVVGTGWPLMGPRQLGWTEVLKYIIDHPFYNQNAAILMNLGVWNDLSSSLQEKIKEVTTWFEPYMVGFFDSAIMTEWKALEKAGVKRVKLSPREAKVYLDKAYEVEWKALEKKIPDLVPALKRVTQ